MGWTQDDVARTVRVSRAAVTSWETDARRAPARALENLDFALMAGGSLVDLVRGISSQGSRDCSRLAGPRRRWGHLFLREPGPAWAWVRPAAGDRVAGYCGMGLLGMPFDEVTGPDGMFLTTPHTSARLPMRVMLSEPGRVDFGRGTVPSWLERPVKTSAGLADAELARHPIIECFAQEIRDRDRGSAQTLRDRLRALVGPERWDRLESQVRRGEEPAGDAYHEPGTDPRPPDTAEERIALHRRMREARGMSQAGAAAAASALLARASGPRGPGHPAAGPRLRGGPGQPGPAPARAARHGLRRVRLELLGARPGHEDPERGIRGRLPRLVGRSGRRDGRAAGRLPFRGQPHAYFTRPEV
jgi:DNA-binding XRE family transcriptional regulator